MKKLRKLLCFLALVAAFGAAVACGGDKGNSSSSSSSLVSSDSSSQSSSVDPADSSITEDSSIGDGIEEITGVYIIYDLGDCPIATMKSTRQEVTTGEAYTLYTPHVPVLSNYGFIGWKNVVTGEIVENEGVYEAEVSTYLIAVWEVYGPAV